MLDTIFVVQSYTAKPHRLVPLPAQLFGDEASARRAGGRLARYKAGVVVMAQTVDPQTSTRGRPEALAIHGTVPDGWTIRRAA